MEWLALLVGIGIISSLFDKKSKDSSHSTKVTTPRKTNKWDSEIQGKGVVYGSSWDRIRKSVLARDNYTCRSCRRKDNLTVDHIVQLSQGGTNNLENLQTLCKYCHEKKDNRKIFGESFNHDSNYGSITTSSPANKTITPSTLRTGLNLSNLLSSNPEAKSSSNRLLLFFGGLPPSCTTTPSLHQNQLLAGQ